MYGINSRMKTEASIRMIVSSVSRLPNLNNKEKRDWKKIFKSVRDFWNYNKALKSNTLINRVPEEKDKESGEEKVLEKIMARISQIWQKI